MATRLVQPATGSPAWFFAEVERAQNALSTHVIDMTPELAKTMLDMNAGNRSVRNVKVQQYAADMVAGKWQLNGEPIIVAKDGHLNDGQHRCLAVVESNCSVPAIVMFGLERDSRLTVDQGAVRCAGDILGMEGTQNAALVAAITRMVIAYERSKGANLGSSQYVTTAEIRERIATDPQLAEAATFGSTNSVYSRNFAPGSIIGFAFYILNKVHMADARIFMERCCRGDGLKIGDPAHTLREKLVGEGKTSRDRKITMLFKAWNFYRRGMKVRPGSLNSSLPFPALL